MRSLFDEVGTAEGDRFLRRVEALVAPAAANAGAVVDDPAVLDIAHAVYEAFGADASGGLTRAQIARRCRDVCDEAQFQSRFELFVRMGMLLPHFDKAHQQRYVFNPTSAAGLLVFDRLAKHGGVDELVTLLDRTRVDLESGNATFDGVRNSLRQAQRMMTISADHLLRMVASSPLAELVSERRHHTHATLMDDVRLLNERVVDTFPSLDPEMLRLVVETQRYVNAREQFVTRLLDEGSAAQDFSLLDPEDYLSAALTADLAALAEVFKTTVFDPPSPWLDPSALVHALADHRPHAPTRRRPPRASDPVNGTDPIQRIEARALAARERVARAMELSVQGASEADLTSQMRASGWPGAARLLVNALAAHADPDLPYRVAMSDDLYVEAAAPLTHATPVTVHRAANNQQDQSGAIQGGQSHVG